MRRAFCTYVYKNYDRFIPWYVTSISYSYPADDILIIVDKELDNNLVRYLKSFKKVKVILSPDQYEGFNIQVGFGAAQQTFRHFMVCPEFFDYDKIYFGDVDILIFPEREDLFEFHDKQCKRFSLPFSNKVRTDITSGRSSKRLTGLHYIQVRSYYNSIEPLIQKCKIDKSFLSEVFSDALRNEHVLYNLCKIAFGFDDGELQKANRPWHGFHLGILRSKSLLDEAYVKNNSGFSMKEIYIFLLELHRTHNFDKLLRDFKCREMYNLLSSSGIRLSPITHLNYKLRSCLSYLIQQKKLVHAKSLSRSGRIWAQ